MNGFESMLDGFRRKFFEFTSSGEEIVVAQTFDEFNSLSRKHHATDAVADVIVAEEEPGNFRLSAQFAAWRGDQADKVTFQQVFSERIVGNPDSEEGQRMIDRLALTVSTELEDISIGNPRAKIKMGLLIERRDGRGRVSVITPELRSGLKDEPGLLPLNLVTQPTFVSSFSNSAASTP
ncbi:MAG: hypothetical protein HYW63_04245 [Candidatus Levybacteria bacterium]|nr:hypothetical protein [Candidatus Levybacteria bacterium]